MQKNARGRVGRVGSSGAIVRVGRSCLLEYLCTILNSSTGDGSGGVWAARVERPCVGGLVGGMTLILRPHNPHSYYNQSIRNHWIITNISPYQQRTYVNYNPCNRTPKQSVVKLTTPLAP